MLRIDEIIQRLIESRWQYSRKEERKRWVRNPSIFANYMAAQSVFGYSFMKLSPDALAQVKVDREKARQAALTFIQGKTP